MRYATAEAFRAAIEDRLRTAARQDLIVRQRKLLVFERLLARLLEVAPERWVVKGALALGFRFGDQARLTKDLDLAHSVNEATAIADLIKAQAVEIADYFTFQIKRTTALDVLPDATAVRYRVAAQLAGRRFEEGIVDVGFGGPNDIPVERLEGPAHLVFAGISPIELPVISLELHVAEKLHAYTQTYGDGRTSTRVKDLVDIVLIQSLAPMRAGLVRMAIDATFSKRVPRGAPASIPIPPSGWEPGYERLAGATGLDPDIDVGFAIAAAFLDPILSGAAADNASWDPERGDWRVAGTALSAT